MSVYMIDVVNNQLYREPCGKAAHRDSERCLSARQNGTQI